MSQTQPYIATDNRTVALQAKNMMIDTGVENTNALSTHIRNDDKVMTTDQDSRAVRNQMNFQYHEELQYQRNTDLLVQMNESWNVNSYLANSVKGETVRMNKLDNLARRDIYMLRKRIMYADYMTNYYRMMTSVIVMALFATLVLLIPAAMWRANRLGMKTLVVIDGIVLALFLLVMVYTFSRFATRNNEVWKQRRWMPSQTMLDQLKSNEQSCDSGEPVEPVVDPLDTLAAKGAIAGAAIEKVADYADAATGATEEVITAASATTDIAAQATATLWNTAANTTLTQATTAKNLADATNWP
jgi:hypothetical protein